MNEKMMRQLILLLTVLIILPYSGFTCSMYKITADGKTIVGNNEDWLSPNSQFWFVPGEEGQYGVMNVGFLNNFAQGAINEAGLMFDGFANPYLAVNNVSGKLNVPIGEAVQHVMHSFDNVKDVEKYLSTINLSSLTTGMLVFVDRAGEYLIVEGDELLLGNDDEKVFSNFYYSQVESIETVELENVRNGLEFLNKTEAESSVDYCSSVMNSISNPQGFTQYSTIYDLDKLTIRVYLYHDFNAFVEIDLKEEIGKGAHRTMLVDLFPDHSEGYKHYQAYNDKDNPLGFVKDFVGDDSRSEEELVRSGYASNLNTIGYEWLLDKNDPKGAIEIFKYATELMPNNANLFDSLGEAYLADNNYEAAEKSYSRSLELNPANENAKAVLERIKSEGQK